MHSYKEYGLDIDKYKQKLIIVQSIGIIVIKSKETRMITYTLRYSSTHLTPDTTEL